MITFAAVSGELAHLVERLVRNQKVTGSSPVFSTSFCSVKEESPCGSSFFRRKAERSCSFSGRIAIFALMEKDVL